MKIDKFSQDIIDLYKLQEKATPDGFVYVEVRRGMYGLPQAGLLAQKTIRKTPRGIWLHAKQVHSRLLVPQDTSDILLISRG